MPYRVSALAEQDLDEIWSRVAEDASPPTADRLIDAIVDRFEFCLVTMNGAIKIVPPHAPVCRRPSRRLRSHRADR